MRFAEPADAALSAHSYPSTTDALIAEYGDVRVSHSNGSVTLGELLAHLPDEPVESLDEARLLIWGSFDEAAIGRKAYSDRDPPGISDTTYRQISF